MTSYSYKINYSYSPSPENAAATHSALNTLELQWQPDLVDLNTDQRQSMRKMNPDFLDFARTALSFARANPQMMPAIVDLDTLEKDLAAYDALKEMLRSLAKSHNMCEDSLMALADKILSNASRCYAAFQSAEKQGEPGAELIVKQLSKPFAKSTKASAAPADPHSDDEK